MPPFPTALQFDSLGFSDCRVTIGAVGSDVPSDVLVVNFNPPFMASVSVFSGDRVSGLRAPAAKYYTGSDARDAVVADWNGDGQKDIVVAGVTNPGLEWIDGSARANAPATINGLTFGERLAVANVDNVGLTEALLVDQASSLFRVVRNDGSEVVINANGGGNGMAMAPSYALATADLNADGFVDAVVTLQSGGFYVWLNSTH